jgi:hypothetical protein
MGESMELKNFIICRLMKDEEIISAGEITTEAANKMKEFITDIYTNETGGITIILQVELFNNTDNNIEIKIEDLI